jgi:hypothetical protein
MAKTLNYKIAPSGKIGYAHPRYNFVGFESEIDNFLNERFKIIL